MSDRQQATSNGEYNNAGQNSGKQTEEKNFVWKTVDSGKRNMARLCRYVIQGIGSPWPEESWKTFVLWILSIIIDPLVLYVPRINDKKKLLDFDRSFLLILSVLYFVVHICMFLIYRNTCKKSYPKLWWIFIVGAPLVPVLTNGPLQLLLIFNSTKRIRASLFSFGMCLFLILYLVRVMGIYRLFIATALRESALLRILINLILYLYGGHIFGGLWYFFAVWKKMQCWSTACKSHRGCHYANNRFNVNSGDNRFLDDICFNMIEDTTYELGIFKDALDSGIVETKNLAKKLLYCLRWGTQNLSGYGQSLTVSTHAWENIFVILIAVYGVATFAFFIGNMQNLIKSPTSKSDREARWTQQDLEKWSPFRKLSKEQQKFILKKCRQCNWPQTGVVNVQNLLSNLPKEDEDNVKRMLCSKLLRKVKEFEGWSDELLNELCDCAKPVSYKKHTQIVQNGSSIDEMFFMVEGKLRTYSFTNTNADSTRPLGKTSISHIEDDGFCGEELIDWFRTDPNSPELPVSTKTIRVVEQVDGFALMSYDLQNVFIKRQEALASMQDQAPPAEP